VTMMGWISATVHTSTLVNKQMYEIVLALHWH